MTAPRWILTLIILPQYCAFSEDPFPPLAGRPPQNLDALWICYDPAKEPLDVQIVHEAEKEGITTRMLVFTVGTFKNVPSRMGADFARRETVEAAAANGYAAITINSSGKPMESQNPGDAGTDWGAPRALRAR